MPAAWLDDELHVRPRVFQQLLHLLRLLQWHHVVRVAMNKQDRLRLAGHHQRRRNLLGGFFYFRVGLPGNSTHEQDVAQFCEIALLTAPIQKIGRRKKRTGREGLGIEAAQIVLLIRAGIAFFRRQRDQQRQMPARRCAHQPQLVGVDAKIRRVRLDVANAQLYVTCHLRGRKRRARSRADHKYRVPMFGQDVVHLRLLVVADLAPIGKPCAAADIHHAETILWPGRRKNVHEQTHPVDLREHPVFLLGIGLGVLSNGRGDGQEKA